MKKSLKWFGIIFLVFLAVIAVFAFLGKGQTLSLELHTVDLASVADGEYAGEYSAYRFSTAVAVTVKDHQIVDIEVRKGQTGREGTYQEMTVAVIDAQSPALDANSGATADKKAFLKAVETALDNAD